MTDALGWTVRSVEARGEIVLWERGVGRAVFLLHGFPDHPIGLLGFADAIVEAGYRCIVPALPGYWPSAAVHGGDYSPAAVGADLLAVMDELDIDRAAYVGHDWGAEIGYPLVAAHPERFTQFIALGTPHPIGYQIRRSVFEELRTAWYAIFLAYAPGACDIARDGRWLSSLVESWSPGMHRAEWPDIAAMLQRPGVMEAVCAYYKANLDEPPSSPTILIPTTIIHGGQDGCISPNAYPDFSRFFPAGLKDILVPDAGHWPHLEAPRYVADIIVRELEA